MMLFNRHFSFIRENVLQISIRTLVLFVFLVVAACAGGPGAEAPAPDAEATKAREIDLLTEMLPSLDALVDSLDAITNLDVNKNRFIDYQDFSEGDLTGCTFDLEEEEDGKRTRRRAKALSGADAGFLINWNASRRGWHSWTGVCPIIRATPPSFHGKPGCSRS